MIPGVGKDKDGFSEWGESHVGELGRTWGGSEHSPEGLTLLNKLNGANWSSSQTH